MADYGIKISKPGYSVLTATDRQLVFSLEFNTFKVFASGSGNVTSDATNPQIVEITHSLGYQPAFFVYSEIHAGDGLPSTGSFYMTPHGPPPIGGSLITDTIITCADTTKLYIRFGAMVVAANEVLNYKYVIFYNQAR